MKPTIEVRFRPRKKVLSLYVPSPMIPGGRVAFMRDLWIDGLTPAELASLKRSIDEAMVSHAVANADGDF